MTASETVSIIIPCHNQGQFLGDAIESALAQTYPVREIIVVDDGSTDDTAEIVASFKCVQCVRQSNQGLAAARNRGLAASRGDLVLFLDADDRLAGDAVQVGFDTLRANPECAFAYGHVALIAADGSPIMTPSQIAVEQGHYLELLRRNYIWTSGAVLYRKPIVELLGGFNASVGPSADFDLNARIARSFKICCTNTVVLEYRRHSQNMSRDYALMLSSAMTARRLQSEFVTGSKSHELAFRDGIRAVQLDYGEKLIDLTKEQISKGNWREAMAGLLVLWHYYPLGFARRVYRMLRHFLVFFKDKSLIGN